MKPFINVKSTKQVLCHDNQVSLVKSFSDNTDLYKILTSEVFIVMLLRKAAA